MTNDEIEAMSRWQWQKLVKQKTKYAVFTFLTKDEETKEEETRAETAQNMAYSEILRL